MPLIATTVTGRATVAIALTIALVVGRSAGAQAHPDPATYPGSLDRGVLVAAHGSGSMPATPAETKGGIAFADQLIAIIKRSPAFASPVGYTVVAKPTILPNAKGPNPDAPFYFGLQNELPWWMWSERDQHIVRSAGAVTFAIYANRLDCLFVDTYWVGKSDSAGTMYMAPRVQRDQTGLEVYSVLERGGGSGHKLFCALLTNIKKPLWVPVSRERYLKSLIARARMETAAYHKDLRANSPKAQLQQHEAQAPSQAADMQAMCDAFKKVDAKSYAQCVDQMKTAQRQMDSVYRATAADPRVAATLATADTSGNGTIAELEAQLAGMSTSERARPALIRFSKTDMGLPSSRLTLPGATEDSTTARIVVPNPDFFDRSLPRTAPQVITVELGGTPYTPADLADRTECVAQYVESQCDIKNYTRFRKMLDSIDWAAIRALLRP